jgi:hypothetical protein
MTLGLVVSSNFTMISPGTVSKLRGLKLGLWSSEVPRSESWAIAAAPGKTTAKTTNARMTALAVMCIRENRPKTPTLLMCILCSSSCVRSSLDVG